MKLGSGINYKYLRIQGRDISESTKAAIGVFSLCEEIAYDGTMDDEDKELFEELNNWFIDELPFPPQCQKGEKVCCYFKTENENEMVTLIKPLLWLLERYQKPYYIVYTNYPGEIVYEDKYQIVAKVVEPEIKKINKVTTGK